MSLDQSAINDLVQLGSPILCVDTCTLLDVIRDITTSFKSFEDLSHGLALLELAEKEESLVVLMSEVVRHELNNLSENEEKRASEGLRKFLVTAERIHKVAVAYGANGTLHINHIDGHVNRAMKIFDRWKTISKEVPLNDGIKTRAADRVLFARSPAARGKDSTNDCMIFETYLALAGQLRSAGFHAPIVFASSNTKEYYAPNTVGLKADIEADLDKVLVEYAPNFGAAKYMLGL